MRSTNLCVCVWGGGRGVSGWRGLAGGGGGVRGGVLATRKIDSKVNLVDYVRINQGRGRREGCIGNKES